MAFFTPMSIRSESRLSRGTIASQLISTPSKPPISRNAAVASDWICPFSGHAGVVNTVAHARKTIRPAKVHALLGGFHLLSADDAHLRWTGEQLREAGVENLLGAHCTGIEAVYRLRTELGLSRGTAVVGSVGASFELGRGIDPRMLAR